MLRDLICPSCGSSFHLLSDETVSRQAAAHRTLGRFRLVERIGLGAFGKVWTAPDSELDRTVAVKIPRNGQLSVEETEAFLRQRDTFERGLRHLLTLVGISRNQWIGFRALDEGTSDTTCPSGELIFNADRTLEIDDIRGTLRISRSTFCRYVRLGGEVSSSSRFSPQFSKGLSSPRRETMDERRQRGNQSVELT
jgi:hypothetical protein